MSRHAEAASPHAASKKTELARRHVRKVNDWTEIAALAVDLEALTPGAFQEIDVALLALDNPKARLLAARLLLAARIPFVDVGALAERWCARVSVCDPGGASRSCVCCAWSPEQIARAGEDVGIPCAGVEGVETGEGFPSSLVMGQRAATLAVREALALAGAVGLRPSVGCELRDDLARIRTESFLVPENPECPADHVLASGTLEHLDVDPDEIHLGELAAELGLCADDEIVLAGGELVSASVCTGCRRVAVPFRRVRDVLPPCEGCGAASAALRRTRRLRWGAAAPQVAALGADAWFEPGDRFAVVSAHGARSVAFVAPPLEWEPGAAWDAVRDAPRFERLPPDWQLERIRRTRVALVGLGHVGSAALQQLAPLPWAGLLLIDRDGLEPRNLPSCAIAAEAGEEHGVSRGRLHVAEEMPC